MGHVASFPVGHLLKNLSHSYRLNDIKMYYTFLCQHSYDVRRCKLTAALGGCFICHELCCFFGVFFLVAFVDGNITSSQVQVFLFVSWLNLSIFLQGVARYPLEQFCDLLSLLYPLGPLLHVLSLQFITSRLLHLIVTLSWQISRLILRHSLTWSTTSINSLCPASFVALITFTLPHLAERTWSC